MHLDQKPRTAWPWLRAAQVARDQAPEVFGEGHTHIAGTLARPALNFRLERDLSARHHDVTNIAYRPPRALRKCGCPL